MQQPNFVWMKFGFGLILGAALAAAAFGQQKFDKKKPDTAQSRSLADSLARATQELELTRNWSFGFQHYRNRQYAEATPYFWKVIAHDSAAASNRQYPQVFDFLGQSYIKLNKLDSAILAYEIGVKIFPAEANLRRTLAMVLARHEYFDLALREYQTLQALNAASPEDLRRQANLLVRVNRYDDAIVVYEKILTLAPNEAEVRQALSALYKSTGRTAAALASMEAALAQNPNDAQLLFELARAQFKQQEDAKAIELLSRYKMLVPTDVTALELLGEVLSRAGRFREALQTYEQINAGNPGDKKALVNSSICYRQLGDFPAARRLANQALAVDKRYGAAFMALGKSYEACADQCVAKKNKADFDDRLVYELAYQQYEKALQDLTTRAAAQQYMNLLAASLPQKEDRFMHKGKNKAAGPCYQWIY